MNVSELNTELAACTKADPDMFFPDQTHGPYKTAEYAKAVCNVCAIKLDCLQVGMTNDYDGIWGGLTQVERETLKRGKRREVRRAQYKAKAIAKGVNIVPRVRKPQAENTLHAMEAANQARALKGAIKQTAQVKHIMDNIKVEVPEPLKSAAELRLLYPEASLQSLAEMSVPPISKDAYSGRLRRLAYLYRDQED